MLDVLRLRRRAGRVLPSMIEAMSVINLEIFVWAREIMCLTLHDTVAGVGIRDSRGVAVVDWLAVLECGENEQTRQILVWLAQRYRCPLLVFYLSALPPRANRGADFRTLPLHDSPRWTPSSTCSSATSGAARTWCGPCWKRSSRPSSWCSLAPAPRVHLAAGRVARVDILGPSFRPLLVGSPCSSACLSGVCAGFPVPPLRATAVQRPWTT